MVVVGALALLALVVPLVSLVAVVRGERPAPPPSDVDAFYALDGELTCDSRVREVPALPLDAEPVAMLVCADPDGSKPWVAPADLVEGDLSRLRAVLDGLEEVPVEGVDCTLQGGPAFDLLLRFSRDRYTRVHGDTGGCGFVTTASGRWFGAPEVLDAALAMVEEQRAHLPPPPGQALDAPGCNTVVDQDYARSLIGDPADIVSAVSCWRPNADEPPPWRGPRPIDPGELALLLEDMAANSTLQEGFDPPDCPGGLDHYYWQDLVGVTRWGDTVVIRGVCRELQVAPNRFWHGDDTSEDTPEVPFWHPSPRAQRILDDLRRPLPS